MKNHESTCLQCGKTSRQLRILITFQHSIDGICNECLGDAIALLAQIERKQRETSQNAINLKVVNSTKG